LEEDWEQGEAPKQGETSKPQLSQQAFLSAPFREGFHKDESKSKRNG